MPELLAVDLGLRTGLALYRGDGRLAWYRSQHFATRETLRRGIAGLLDGLPDVERVVVEGGGDIADDWERACQFRNLIFRQIAAEDWRLALLRIGPKAERGAAKKRAGQIAQRVILWSNARRPTSLRHDAAEAILVGLWGVLDAGWIEQLPDLLLR